MTSAGSAQWPRTLFVNHTSELGGGEMALYDMLCAIGPAHVLLMSAGPLRDRLAAAKIPVEVLPAGAVLDIRRDDGLGVSLRKALPLARLVVRLACRFRRFDIIYANSQKAFVAAAMANAVTRKPLVWHLHDILTEDHFSGLMRWMAIGLSNRFGTRVIANSVATADAYRQAGGRLPVTVVHNGIDPVPFACLSRIACRQALAERIGSGDMPIVGVFGRLAAWKGQHVMLEALERLPGCHLVLVGGALFGDQAYEERLRVEARERGICERVHFLGFSEAVPTLMSGVDVAVHCSVAPEPFGRVIVEAMMAGTPVIAAAAGGALEIVAAGRDGLLVAPGDAGALAAAIGQLIADPALAARLAQAGRQRAETSFSLHASVEHTRAILMVVAASGR